MRELLIVISDLYLAGGDGADAHRSSSAAAGPALPGLQDGLRFGKTNRLERSGGWRALLARWMGRDDLVQASPATVAAADVTFEFVAAPKLDAASKPDASLWGTTWIATPVHLFAGLTSLHLDHRSLLSLSPEELTGLARDFSTTFGDSDFDLAKSPSGPLLLRNRATVDADTTEPSRALAQGLEASLPNGPDASVLRRLGAEMEMWLHSHPLNEARARRGELPVSALWLWGGGPLLASKDRPSASAVRPTSTQPPVPAPSRASTVAFGSDPYLIGLGRLSGTPVYPLPEGFPNLPQSSVPSAAIIAEMTPLLHANPHWTMFDALAEIDRRFIVPALQALRRATVDAVTIVANDTQLRVRRRDLLKFWRRRPKSGSAALLELSW